MSALWRLYTAAVQGPSGRERKSESDFLFCFVLFLKETFQVSRAIDANVFHRKLILKGARHSSNSYDSARHFYSDKLHHKDKWKRRNYCSRRSPNAAAKQCTSSPLLLYH